MGIGTSLGAYYDDEFHYSSAQWDPKYDDNIVNSEPLEPRLGQSPSPLTEDRNNLSPSVMMDQKNQTNDPALIYDDRGNVVDYDKPSLKPLAPMQNDSTPMSIEPFIEQQSMKSQMPFPDNRNPDSDFTSRFGSLPPSGILNDLKKPGDPTPPLVRRINMLEEGNIDLNNRPMVQNGNSISTVLSKSFNFDGKETLLPTVSDDGRLMSDEESINQYKKTGKHLGIFDTPEAADEYAQKLHLDQEKQYLPKK